MKITSLLILSLLVGNLSFADAETAADKIPPLPKNFGETREKIRTKKIKEKNARAKATTEIKVKK